MFGNLVIILPRRALLIQQYLNSVFRMRSEPTAEEDLNLRTKRQSRIGRNAGGSLSIVNSLDVLRNRLLLEIARKKAKEGANRNRQLLMNFGKRAFIQRIPRAYFQRQI
ncbi:hypothetical protein YQE_10478, partial [Dendroctonus ponderosae]